MLTADCWWRRHDGWGADWWRPVVDDGGARPRVGSGTKPPAGPLSRLAFGGLIGFTVVLTLAPQNFLPALAQLRLAFTIAAAATMAHVFSRARGSSAIPLSRETRLVVALVGWAVLTIPLSMWRGGSVSTLTDVYLKSVVIFWLLGEVVNTVGRLRYLIWTLSVLIVPLALTGLRDFATGAVSLGRIGGYQSGLTGNPNDLALWLDGLLPLTFSLVLAPGRPASRILALGIVGLTVATIIATFSRGGFLAMAFMFVLFLLRLIKRGAWTAVAAIAGAILLSVAVLPSGYVQRLQTISDIESDPSGSAQERWRDTVAATHVLAAHPISGTGVGTDMLALNDARGPFWNHVHNTYLMYGVDLGLPGLVLFLALLAASIRTARRVERWAGRGASGAQLAAMSAGIRLSLWGFALNAFFAPVAYHFYFYYLAGLAVALRTISLSARGNNLARGALV